MFWGIYTDVHTPIISKMVELKSLKMLKNAQLERNNAFLMHLQIYKPIVRQIPYGTYIFIRALLASFWGIYIDVHTPIISKLVVLKSFKMLKNAQLEPNNAFLMHLQI